MTFSLYDASVPMFVRGLNVLAGLIDKAAASGLDEESLMQGRLAPDMLPFVSQVRIATDLAKSVPLTAHGGIDWWQVLQNWAAAIAILLIGWR